LPPLAFGSGLAAAFLASSSAFFLASSSFFFFSSSFLLPVGAELTAVYFLA